MQINDKLLQRGGALITRLLQSYTTKIAEAFLTNDEEKFKIGLGLTIMPAKNVGEFELKADISFVSEKIKDTFTERVDEKQMSLQLDEGPGSGKIVKCPNRMVDGIPDEMYASFCNNKCELRKEVLMAEGPDGPFYQSRSCSAWADEDHHSWMNLMVLRCDEKAVPVSAQASPEAPAKKKRGRKPNAEKKAA